MHKSNVDQVPERTRFSMLTAERGESSIHEFINDEMESTPTGRSAQDSRDKDIVLIKAQLDNILEHVLADLSTTNCSVEILSSRPFGARD